MDMYLKKKKFFQGRNHNPRSKKTLAENSNVAEAFPNNGSYDGI